MTANPDILRYFGRAVLSGKHVVAFQIIPEVGDYDSYWEVSISDSQSTSVMSRC